jgi:hypothetical protein
VLEDVGLEEASVAGKDEELDDEEVVVDSIEDPELGVDV